MLLQGAYLASTSLAGPRCCRACCLPSAYPDITLPTDRHTERQTYRLTTYTHACVHVYRQHWSQIGFPLVASHTVLLHSGFLLLQPHSCLATRLSLSPGTKASEDACCHHAKDAFFPSSPGVWVHHCYLSLSPSRSLSLSLSLYLQQLLTASHNHVKSIHSTRGDMERLCSINAGCAGAYPRDL